LKRKKIAFPNLERKMRSQRTKPLEKLHRSVLPLEDTRELHDANLSTHHPVIDSPAIRRRRRSMHTSHKSDRKSSSSTTLKEKPQKETPAQGKQRRERERERERETLLLQNFGVQIEGADLLSKVPRQKNETVVRASVFFFFFSASICDSRTCLHAHS